VTLRICTGPGQWVSGVNSATRPWNSRGRTGTDFPRRVASPQTFCHHIGIGVGLSVCQANHEAHGRSQLGGLGARLQGSLLFTSPVTDLESASTPWPRVAFAKVHSKP